MRRPGDQVSRGPSTAQPHAEIMKLFSMGRATVSRDSVQSYTPISTFRSNMLHLCKQHVPPKLRSPHTGVQRITTQRTTLRIFGNSKPLEVLRCRDPTKVDARWGPCDTRGRCGKCSVNGSATCGCPSGGLSVRSAVPLPVLCRPVLSWRGVTQESFPVFTGVRSQQDSANPWTQPL